MTMRVSFSVEVPKGFRGQQAFTRILEDEVELSLVRVRPDILDDLKRKTVPFRGVTRASWTVDGPRALRGRRRFGMTFVNDGPPRQASGGIIASTFEQQSPGGRARPHRPPIGGVFGGGRGDGRDLIDWVRATLPTEIDSDASIAAQERALERAAFRVARAIGRRGLPSRSNQGARGAFGRVVESYRNQVERDLEGAASRAIARWAEVDL